MSNICLLHIAHVQLLSTAPTTWCSEISWLEQATTCKPSKSSIQNSARRWKWIHPILQELLEDSEALGEYTVTWLSLHHRPFIYSRRLWHRLYCIQSSMWWGAEDVWYELPMIFLSDTFTIWDILFYSVRDARFFIVWSGLPNSGWALLAMFICNAVCGDRVEFGWRVLNCDYTVWT